jgi:translation initiation factor 2-alpha kinase 3
LGCGGFGKVYRAQHNLDQAEYAIKEIVISASELSRLVDSGKIETVLSEVRAMAKLDHHHLVRYFHCWIETRDPKDTDDEEQVFPSFPIFHYSTDTQD